MNIFSKTGAGPDRDEFRRIDPRARTWALFLVSVLGLFLELMLIRWIGTEVRIFAYLQNTVLVVCFLGLGVGCLTCREPIVLRSALIPLTFLAALLALPSTRSGLGGITDLLSVLGDFLIWSNSISTSPLQTVKSVALGLGGTLVLMVLIWDIFVPIGRLTGRLLDDHPRTIWAYSVNVAGALLGIWLFVLLSALGQPPVTWFAVVAVLTLGLVLLGAPGRDRRLDAALLALLVGLAWMSGREPGAIEARWSPYQKLVLRPVDPAKPDQTGREEIGKYLVTVNNAGYQWMLDLDPARVAADPEHFPPAMAGLSQYDIPYLLHPRPKTALIVGAGTGNDAAGALRNRVERVTAVEIDPVILDMGRRYHPEKPYSSPRVVQVNDDARSYFATCKDRFDVIAFGLLDSHTTTAMTNARLDHYVYTIESLRHARSLLADGGIVALSFEVQKPYIADRMATALRTVFGADPLCFRIPPSRYGWGGVMFIAGNLDGVNRQLAQNPRLEGHIRAWMAEKPIVLTRTTRIATDDWPYIYLKSPSIPLLYYLLAALLVLLLARASLSLDVRRLVSGWGGGHWHFFFMGAAFLLLEVQNISKASVALGNTWLVNAVIITGILAMVLLANLIVARFPGLPGWPVYLGLCGTCVALYFVDVSRFAFLPFWTKAAIVGGLTSLPMLFSGIIFIQSFAAFARKDQALGANLIGALVGGLLQSITFVTGLRALLLIVTGLYLAALLTRPGRALALPSRHPGGPPGEKAPTGLTDPELHVRT